MKIPEEVKIGGLVYKIVQEKQMDGCYGRLNKGMGQIIIEKDMPDDQKMANLLHEVLHAINSGLDEEIVNGTALSLYEFLKDNNLRF
jgi:hypothetical protein